MPSTAAPTPSFTQPTTGVNSTKAPMAKPTPAPAKVPTTGIGIAVPIAAPAAPAAQNPPTATPTSTTESDIFRLVDKLLLVKLSYTENPQSATNNPTPTPLSTLACYTI